MKLTLADARELLRGARRTRVLRLVLAAGAVLLIAAAVLAATARDPGATPLAEPGRTTVLVLDVSSSIEPGQYRQVASTLDRAIAEGGRFGVVLFSDVAYELVPPGTPAAELAGLRRFFVPLPAPVAGAEAVEIGATRFPRPPWGDVFSSGTRISAGLGLAAAVLERERIENGTVVLVSDLQDEREDLPPLGRVLAAYADAGLPLRVVGLASKPEDERVFKRLVGADTIERAAPSERGSSGDAVSPPEPFPLVLVALGLALALLLAANEHLLARLPLRHGEGAR